MATEKNPGSEKIKREWWLVGLGALVGAGVAVVFRENWGAGAAVGLIAAAMLAETILDTRIVVKWLTRRESVARRVIIDGLAIAAMGIGAGIERSVTGGASMVGVGVAGLLGIVAGVWLTGERRLS